MVLRFKLVLISKICEGPRAQRGARLPGGGSMPINSLQTGVHTGLTSASPLYQGLGSGT